MDIWQRIENDHANIGQLIHETPHALNGPGVVRSRERLLGDLVDELDRHGAALSASLYPPLRRDPHAARLVDDLAREQSAFMGDLRALARRRGDSAGWLARFEDVTYAVDHCLHRHAHELVPIARETLSAEAVEQAGRTYVRAKLQALRGRGRGPVPGASILVGGSAVAGAAITAVAGLALLAWRLAGYRRRDGATETATGDRRGGEDLRARQDRFLDEALEDTFPASDPVAPKRITR